MSIDTIILIFLVAALSATAGFVSALMWINWLFRKDSKDIFIRGNIDAKSND